MKKPILLLIIFAFIFACKKDTDVQSNKPSGIHKVVVQEVIQVKEYTYLLVDEGGIEKWLAAPSVKVEKGKTYYFKNGMEMSNFQSKELNRKFDKILFIDKLSTNPDLSEKIPLNTGDINNINYQAAKPKFKKEKISIERDQGVTTIIELYKNRKEYAGKKIRVKGKVTKFNPAIMKKNWIHLQDGTSYNNKFDLTVTVLNDVKVGDIVTVEGVISVDKDFGYGYKYEIIMENAKIIN